MRHVFNKASTTTTTTTATATTSTTTTTTAAYSTMTSSSMLATSLHSWDRTCLVCSHLKTTHSQQQKRTHSSKSSRKLSVIWKIKYISQLKRTALHFQSNFHTDRAAKKCFYC